MTIPGLYRVDGQLIEGRPAADQWMADHHACLDCGGPVETNWVEITIVPGRREYAAGMSHCPRCH